MCADPNASIAVFRQREYLVIRKTVLRGVHREPAVMHNIEAAAVGTNPQISGAVFEQRMDGVVRQTVLGSEGLKRTIMKARQPSSHRTDPQVSGVILQQRIYNVALQRRCIALIEDRKTHAVKSNQAQFGTGPQITIWRLNYGGNSILWQTFLGPPHVLMNA
jgi:hypothetical protein